MNWFINLLEQVITINSFSLITLKWWLNDELGCPHARIRNREDRRSKIKSKNYMNPLVKEEGLLILNLGQKNVLIC